MKLLGAVFVVLLVVAPLPAQYYSVGGFGNVVFPGLGHAPAGNPWGNVVQPAVPRGSAFSGGYAVPVNRGGGVGGVRAGAGQGYRHRGTAVYAYPVYVGGYGYAPSEGYGYPSDQAGPPPSEAGGSNGPAQPPVVINQYFTQGAPDQGPRPDSTADPNYRFYQAPSNNDTAAGDTSYYLIAFKDHTIYSAVAYYTEGDTLHYFTSGNVHNQVSLALVDRPLTEKLNRERNVDVRLP